MSEVGVIELWLRSTLADDAALTTLLDGGGVYNGKIPVTQPKPSIVFDYVDATDHQNSSADIIWTDAEYNVKVVAPGENPGDCDAIYTRVHTLIHQAEGSATNGQVRSCTRIQPLRYVDDLGYLHWGGRYRILAQLNEA